MAASRGQLATLLWAKARVAAHTLASARQESKLKVAFVSISAALLLFGIFGGAVLVFRMLETFGAELLGGGGLSLGDLVMARLLSTFALTVFVLLVFSNVLIAYATFFRSQEMPRLVLSPLPVSTLFLGRFVECLSFSSWATAFLGAPILLAYGLEASAPWPFYPALVAFYLPFVVIPAALGAILALGLVRLLAHARRRLLMFGVLGAGAALGMFQVFRRRLDTPDLSDPA
ncbi:MAG: hypothetical protein MI919_34825, partial [Holophagales bacterium]|nr:hypothetical protein [Holophagales bacterium]